MRSFFPLSARVHDIKTMSLTIVFYLVVSVGVGVAASTLMNLEFFGMLRPLLSLAAQMANLYCLGGIVTAVLFYRNLIG